MLINIFSFNRFFKKKNVYPVLTLLVKLESNKPTPNVACWWAGAADGS